MTMRLHELTSKDVGAISITNVYALLYVFNIDWFQLAGHHRVEIGKAFPLICFSSYGARRRRSNDGGNAPLSSNFQVVAPNQVRNTDAAASKILLHLCTAD
jgi:hypothetical protein